MAGWSSKYQHFKNKVKEIVSPITGPILTFIKPAHDKWLEFTSPVRSSWQAYKKRNPRESKLIIWSLRLVWLGILSVLLIIMLTWFGVFGKIPTFNELSEIENANATEIYTSDGVMIGKFFTENRTTIALDSISPYLVTALLAIEDKRFFVHSGIDLRSWMRVFKGIALNEQNLGGGSTLSQQLAKNLFPRKNYKIPGISIFINKVKENIISIKLEKLYNKEELLIMYLNTVPFGGNRYGIQEAARYFYGKRPKTLTPDESATLIGMLKATTALDPIRNPNDSKKRRNLVLNQMLKNKNFRFDSEEMATISSMINIGVISEEQYKKLIELPLNAEVHQEISNNDGIGTYFREYLRTKELPRILSTLTKEDGSSYNLYTDGLKIITTLDSKMQENGEKAVAKHMSYLQREFVKHWKGVKDEKPWGDDKWIDEQVVKSDRYKHLVRNGMSKEAIDSAFTSPVPMKIFVWTDIPTERDTMMTPLDSVRYYFTLLNCGFLAMDHTNGYIKSWVGGTDFKYFQYDHIMSKRQVGSTFKPIVYAAALQENVTPCEYFKNKQVTIEDWTPDNSDGIYGGYYSMSGGLTYSTNVIAAQLIEKVGIKKTIDLAQKMGVTSEMPREYGISLGAADIALYDMIKVFGTLANKGVRPEPVFILQIQDRHGNIIYDYEELKQTNPDIGPHVVAMDSMTALTMTRMLQSVIIYGTGNPLRSQFVPHGDFAGKTGTTQNHADGWFISYNPTLVTGAWVGGPSPAVRFRTMNLGSGAAMALPIVGNFWYATAIETKSAKITQQKFSLPDSVLTKFNCPFRISVTPDTLQMLLQDTLYRDTVIRSGYSNLQQFVRQKFGYPEPEIENVDDDSESQKPDSGENNNDKKSTPDSKGTLSDPKTKEQKKEIKDPKNKNG